MAAPWWVVELCEKKGGYWFPFIFVCVKMSIPSGTLFCLKPAENFIQLANKPFLPEGLTYGKTIQAVNPNLIFASDNGLERPL